MFVRRGPAIVLSLALGAAALAGVPGASASDGGAAKDGREIDRDRQCDGPGGSSAKLKVTTVDGNSTRLQVVGVVFSDDDDLWDWRLRHNGDLSDDGRARGREDIDRAFRVTRTMINFDGVDTVAFRAENLRTGEVCRAIVDF
jgi:hypothetical protein